MTCLTKLGNYHKQAQHKHIRGLGVKPLQVQLFHFVAKTLSRRCETKNMTLNFTGTSTTALSNHSVLENYFCFKILPDPEFDKVADRYTTNLVTGVINVVLSPFGVVANLLIVWVICRKVSLRTPLNLLLGCLAVSDFMVGLLVQPSYVAYRLTENQHMFVPCALRLFYSTGFFMCYGVSLVTLCSISCERFLALFFPLQYQHLIRYSRVIKLVIVIWIVNIILTVLQWAHNEVARGIHLVTWLLLLLTAVASQLRILPIIRRHQKQIKRLHSGGRPSCQRSISSHSQMQIKFAANIACIVAVYLAFNLPVLLITAFHQIILIDINTYNLYSWAETAAFLNSSVNPVICLWRVKAIRRAVRQLWPRAGNGRRVPGYLSSSEIPDNDVALVRFRRRQEPQLVFVNSAIFSTNAELSEK